MTIEEYNSSKQYSDFLALIKNGIEEKAKIQDDDALTSKKKAEKIACLSKKLMKEIRRLKLFIRNDYIEEFRSGTIVTINPEDDRVKVSIKKREQNDYTIIYANSCGPFNPQIYFMPDIRTKFQFLKESYITMANYDNIEHPDRGGHNLADYYSTWKKIEEAGEQNKTKGLFIDLIKTLDEKIDGISDDDAKTDDEAMNKAMESICFFELNLFPALSLKGQWSSDDELIKKWVQFNREIFKYLIKFYSPVILIGAGKNNGVNTKIQEVIDLFKPLDPISYDLEINLCEPYKLVKYDHGFIFIDACHPSYIPLRYDRMKWAGKAIRSFLTDKKTSL